MIAMTAWLVPALAFAQSNSDTTKATEKDKDTAAAAARAALLVPAKTIQNLRPVDQRGLTVFEAPKNDGVPFDGFRLNIGGAFTQQFQSLKHENTARLVNGVNQNALMAIGNGFNNAVANLYINAQLAPGIRVAMTSYLSSRHHQETWVKDGYLLVDASPIDHPLLNKVMEYVTLKAGHFEINYGDAHFRRTDNGHSMFNPFVGNYILDAFTTEIGTELYVRKSGLMGMVAVTAGEVKGSVTDPSNRTPSVIGKLGFDRQVNEDLRLRLTGSGYMNKRSPSNTLYAGDRAGSRYYFVLEGPTATANANFTSGLLNPAYSREVKAFMVNPFVKFRGLEVFGLAEKSEGRNPAEWTAKAPMRGTTQYAADAIYRLWNDKLYFGGRYNTVDSKLAGPATNLAATVDVNVKRYEFGGGWFVTPLVMLKAAYVDQRYSGFLPTDLRNGGRFKGLMIEGGVAF
jgi:hypothetical protein